MQNKKTIVLTGGGTAGHVMPHLALLADIKNAGWNPVYIGTDGIEKTLIVPTGIDFYTIKTGKLRRYFSWQNFLDVIRLFIGILQSFIFLLKIRPQLVFSKGGFVSVPVAVAAWVLKIPVVTHESDVTPGLANRIILKFTKKMLYSFPESKKYFPAYKSEYVGSFVRKELLDGDRELGYQLTNFLPNDTRKIILVMGGSQGAKAINDTILASLQELTEHFRFIHLTGKGKKLPIQNSDTYIGFEFVKEELKDLFAITDFVICRAGANSIFELLTLQKPMLLIPLEVGSRGDQVVNAESFEQNNWAMILREKNIDSQAFKNAIEKLVASSDKIKQAQQQYSGEHSIKRILEIFNEIQNVSY